LAHRFNAAPNNPITTLHATAPARDITVAHVPKPKVGSADAAASTVRGRSALIENVLHAVAVPSNAQTEEKRHMDAQRQSVVKRELPAYTAAVESAAGVRLGPFTVEELMELKKFTGYAALTTPSRFPDALLRCDRQCYVVASAQIEELLRTEGAAVVVRG